VALASFLVLSWAFLLKRKAQAHHAPPSPDLKPRCPDDGPACRLAAPPSSSGGPAPADVASLAPGQKPAGSPQAREYGGLRLSQPAVSILRDQRCSHACGFLAMAPLVALSGSRRLEALPATPRSALEATLRSPF
jgi:hypothetical protein